MSLSVQTVPSSPPASGPSRTLQATERLSIMIELWNRLQPTQYCFNDRAQLCRTLDKIAQSGKCDTLNPYGQDEEDVFFACFLFLSEHERLVFLKAAKESWKEGAMLDQDKVVESVLAGSESGSLPKKQRDSALCMDAVVSSVSLLE